MKIWAVAALLVFAGCASKPSADPFAPSQAGLFPKLKTKVYQLYTEYPEYPQTEIDDMLTNPARFGRNGNSLEEQGIIHYLADRGVPFESTRHSMLWIPHPLTQPTGWPTRKRALIIVRQTEDNLKKLDRIFGGWEAGHQKDIRNEN